MQRVEPPQIQYTSAHLSTVTEASACAATGKRRMVPGTNTPYPPVVESIRKQQEQFQVHTKDDTSWIINLHIIEHYTLEFEKKEKKNSLRKA